jgi:hypothetical protein
MKFSVEINVDKMSSGMTAGVVDRLRWLADRIESTLDLSGLVIDPERGDEIGVYGVDRAWAWGGDGAIAIEQEMLPGIFRGSLGVSIAGKQAWICIDGAAAIRFSSRLLVSQMMKPRPLRTNQLQELCCELLSLVDDAGLRAKAMAVLGPTAMEKINAAVPEK